MDHSANKTVTCLNSACWDSAIAEPQASQNRASGRGWLPHDRHFTAAVIRHPPLSGSAALRIRRTTERGTVIDASLSHRRQAFNFRNQFGATAKSAKQLGATARVDPGSTSCLTAMLSKLSHRTLQFLTGNIYLGLLHVTSRCMGEREVHHGSWYRGKRLRRCGFAPGPDMGSRCARAWVRGGKCIVRSAGGGQRL